jgi:hypothetical protein
MAYRADALVDLVHRFDGSKGGEGEEASDDRDRGNEGGDTHE